MLPPAGSKGVGHLLPRLSQSGAGAAFVGLRPLSAFHCGPSCTLEGCAASGANCHAPHDLCVCAALTETAPGSETLRAHLDSAPPRLPDGAALADSARWPPLSRPSTWP